MGQIWMLLPEEQQTEDMREQCRDWIEQAEEWGVELQCFFLDSACEGDWVDGVQEAMDCCCGIILCPSAALCESIALRDAISAVGLPVVEVRLLEKVSTILSAVCRGCVMGFGEKGLLLALEALCYLERGETL